MPLAFQYARGIFVLSVLSVQRKFSDINKNSAAVEKGCAMILIKVCFMLRWQQLLGEPYPR